jgi:hypothetical protein
MGKERKWIMRSKWRAWFPGQRRPRMLIAVIGAGACVAGLSLPVAAGAQNASHAAVSRKVNLSALRVEHLAIKRVGTVDMLKLSRAAAAHRYAKVRGKPISEPLRVPPALRTAASRAARVTARTPRATPITRFAGNVRGARGFNGQTAKSNESTLGFDVSPPDEGMAVGTSSRGTAIVQSLNLTISMYKPDGKLLSGPVAASTFFKIGTCSGASFPDYCPTDPRVYWDPQTHHWFLTEFTFASSPPAKQYIAVSKTSNALGKYEIFSIPTSTSLIDQSDCPCFGDFDMIGADNSGFYITTNEFGQSSFHGTNIYALSKQGLIAAAEGKAPPPKYFQYPIPTLADPFAAYHLAPSSVAQGSKAPNTEYFVESDANLLSDSSLEVWALLHTNSLNAKIPTAPKLVETGVATKGYSLPPNATQKAGPIPLGNILGAVVASPLETDFDAVQETTYANGELYAQLNTGVSVGGGATNAAGMWFALHPMAGRSSLSVANNGNGYVAVRNGHMLYPSIAVNAWGKGYMAFTTSGANGYPSAAYVKFRGSMGAVGPIHVARAGRFPLDDFTCYPGDGFGPACRYGDYSASQVYNGRIYMAAEYIHYLTPVNGGFALSNWGTRIWSAPVP